MFISFMIANIFINPSDTQMTGPFLIYRLLGSGIADYSSGLTFQASPNVFSLPNPSNNLVTSSSLTTGTSSNLTFSLVPPSNIEAGSVLYI